MVTTTPTFTLSTLVAYAAQPAGIYLAEREPVALQLPCFHPFRSSYYNLGLCLHGHAELQVNLETYRVQPGGLLVLPAHCIKQWGHRSADFASLDVSFTADFLAPTPGGQLGPFTYFDGLAPHVLPLPPGLHARLQVAFEQLHRSYYEPHLHRTDLLQNRLRILLYEAAAAYAAFAAAITPGPARAQLITNQFKQLVQAHCIGERQLAFYAGQLCISPKHLTETIRAATGRGAAPFITEAVTLEARLRLQNPALTVAQVADELHFADQSAFARYFRHATNQTPTAYRQQLAAGSPPFSDFLPNTAAQKP
ncbi:helix-turn-helix domain-containing protein [Hymenobacter sp. H14-R3]|uniref:helix-turn-helix domain-containing protein n=1 Tax=Hymenobacter sp. H14-R3 TaxID=3046308 RepID=UPI0024BA9A4B|nr:helix-turn-helix domain-containing protein [Hymenobacter sp. H14-R3]MDJ0367817.1 helix-turn-helix domain-containing protein [Hymenobacter sp. H14-R3]